MSNRKDGTAPGEQAIHPSSDAGHHISERFPAMRGGVRILQPVGDCLRRLRLDLREGSPRPATEIAIAQHWLDSRVERKAFGCLRGAARRAAQNNVTRREAPGKPAESFSSARIERLIRRKGDGAHRRGRG